MDTFRQDLRFAVRMLAKNPGLTAVAVFCIALGIGANTTAFSVVQAVLLRPFPYADPERIVAVHMTNLRKEIDEGSPSYVEFLDLREQSRSFTQMSAYGSRSLVVSGKEEPERALGAAVSASLFPMLGELPALGRNFREDEDRPGAPPVILLGHDLWMRRFDGDPGIVGKTVIVNSTAHTVVGVMKPRFRFPSEHDAWVPLGPLAHAELRSDRGYPVLARLKPGVTLEQAEAEMKTIARRLEQLHPDTNTGWSAMVRSLRDEFADGSIRLVVLTMQGAVVFVLLIACANVANLLLARATARQREVAIRVAFGAGRWRIVRQLLTESVLIGLLGGVLGILCGYWGIRWMEASIPAEDAPPYWIRFVIDGPVLLFTLGVAVLTGILFGLAPALQAARSDLNATLKEGGRGAGGSVRRNRLRSGLVVGEVALSLILLVGASLFVRSFLKLQNASAGFDTARLLTMRIFLPGERYEEPEPKTRRVEDVIRRLEALPGVEAVGVSNTIPLSGGGSGGGLVIDGRPFPRGEEPGIFWTGVTPHFFQAIDVPVLRGRGFTDREGMERSAVALVNETFVKRFFPDAEVLGRRFRVQEETEMGWITIVGVVPDFRADDIGDEEISPSAYLPYPYLATRSTGLTIRTALDPAQATAKVREEIRASDPELPVYQVLTMEQVRQQGFWEFRFFGGMFSVFGGIALFLAAIGVYGVLSYSVSQRVREIGIRVALGAQRGHVLRLIVGQGLSLALTGVAFGLLGAFVVTRVIRSLLYDVSPTDPLSFGVIAFLLTAVAWLASFLPANRALEVDPLEALRNE
ncbi:MAG TPA: ABC transporter permease [Thermoanaerobaculia bacterium]|nr:ABC transporter permease [Thermoanaerobaculia bacterium]